MLPYLDRLTLEIVPDRDAELLRLQSGEIDFTQTEVRGSDYATLRQAEERGELRLYDLGVALDADFLFFNLQSGGHGRRSTPRVVAGRRVPPRRVTVGRPPLVRRHPCIWGWANLSTGPSRPANHRWHEPNIVTHDFNLARGPRAARQHRARRFGRGRHAGGFHGRTSALRPANPTGQLGARAGPPRCCSKTSRRSASAVDVVHLEFGALIERITSMNFDAVYLGIPQQRYGSRRQPRSVVELSRLSLLEPESACTCHGVGADALTS